MKSRCRKPGCRQRSPGYSYCARCRANWRRLLRKYRATRERHGLCIDSGCREPAAPDRKRCETHLYAQRVRKQARKGNPCE